MDKHKIFANNLKAIRKAKGLTIAEYSAMLDIPRSTLQNVLVDGHMTLDTAVRISEHLDVSLDALMGDELLAERLGLLQMMIAGITWFADLSADDQTLVLRNIHEILALVQERPEG